MTKLLNALSDQVVISDVHRMFVEQITHHICTQVENIVILTTLLTICHYLKCPWTNFSLAFNIHLYLTQRQKTANQVEAIQELSLIHI